MGGFNFDNYPRNEFLKNKGFTLPRTVSTGTTIVGCKFKNGVVLASDTRATSGVIVADKNCQKLHQLSKKIWCAGAGTAADTDKVTQLISSNLELHSLSENREPRVVAAVTMLKQHLFKYQGYIQAYLIVAGVDPTGVHLLSIHAHGSSDVGSYLSLGSGSLAALAILETGFKKDMSKNEAVELCCDAIKLGIMNDLGSGSNVDVCIMEKDKETILERSYASPVEKFSKSGNYKFERGSTLYMKESVREFETVEESVINFSPAPVKMEIDT